MKYSVLTLALSMALLSACSSSEETEKAPDISTPPVVTTPDNSIPDDVIAPDDTQDDTDIEDETSGETSDEVTDDTTDDNTSEQHPVDIVALETNDFTLFSEGNTYKVVVLAMGKVSDINYKSDNEDIATVAEDGTVTAMAPGVATITVTFNYEGEAKTLTAVARCRFETQSDTPETPEAPETPAPAPEATISLSAFYSSLGGYEGMAGMQAVEGDFLNNFYPGLSGISTNQRVIYMPMMTSQAVEIAIVEVSDPSQVASVKAIFQQRINDQVAGGAWYPETIEGWQNNAKIVSNGNYVMMICHPSSGAITGSFNALF